MFLTEYRRKSHEHVDKGPSFNLQLKLKVQNKRSSIVWCSFHCRTHKMPEDEGNEAKTDTVLSRKLKKVAQSSFSSIVPCNQSTYPSSRSLILGLKMIKTPWTHWRSCQASSLKTTWRLDETSEVRSREGTCRSTRTSWARSRRSRMEWSLCTATWQPCLTLAKKCKTD